LRGRVRSQVKALSPEKREADAASAMKLLENQAAWRDAKSILFFAPLSDEPDIWPLAQSALVAGKTVALPRFSPQASTYVICQIRDFASDIGLGHFGIREPAESCISNLTIPLDLVLVPGVAFDLHGRRLGRGKGYYDQLLATVRGTTCGVAFDEQIVPEIPIEPHDIAMNCILTPTRWILP
jgi:5-formyltetrahydrofolate cyclo-ligase